MMTKDTKFLLVQKNHCSLLIIQHLEFLLDLLIFYLSWPKGWRMFFKEESNVNKYTIV